MNRVWLCTFSILLGMSFNTIEAQIMKSSFFRNSEIQSGLNYQSWSTENDLSVSEFTLPLSFIVPVNKRLTLNVTTSTAVASLNTASGSLGGLTDTRISGSYVTPDDRFLFTAGVFLPTGNTALEDDQGVIASALSFYPLNFRVPSFGQGLMANLGGIVAFEYRNWVLGGGLGFVFKNGFKPFAGSDIEYVPGNEMSVNFGGETNISKVKLTVDLTYTIYGKDTYDNTEIFKSGNKIIADVRALFNFSNMDLLIYLRERTKGKNDRGVGSINTEEKNSNGNQLELGGLGYYPINEAFALKGLADIKIYSKNEYENNGAFLFGLGAGFNYQMNEQLSFDILGKFSTGSLTNQSLSTGITGIEFGGNIKYRL
ncbi:MAG: hypothetical protein ACM3RX_08400 [Methanococcaceae archaeon]